MKKFVKPLVVAASVAAIAGIGAVSFAKWTGTGTTKVDDITLPNTGSITYNGLSGSLTTTSGLKLVPIDQDAANGYNATTMTHWYDFTLTVTGTAADCGNIYMKVTAADLTDDGLYVKANATAADAQKEAASDYVAGDKLTSGSHKAILNNVAAGTYYVRLILKSDAMDTSEMNKTIAVEFNLSSSTPT